MAEHSTPNINASGGSFVNTGEMNLTGSTINLGKMSGTTPHPLQPLQETPTDQELPSGVQQLKRDRLQRELEQLVEEYQAVSDEYGNTLDPSTKVRLKRQLEGLETRMSAIEIELGSLPT